MELNLYQKFLTSRLFWFVIISVTVFMAILAIVPYLPKPGQTPGNDDGEKQGVFKLSDLFDSEKKPDLEAAVNEQLNVVEETVNFENRVAGRYVWRKKLPLTSDKYFVYFDFTKKGIVARLYPDNDDVLEELKAEIIRKLKKDREIPLEDFRFDIDIYPKSNL